jgi:hypothetical protein
MWPDHSQNTIHERFPILLRIRYRYLSEAWKALVCRHFLKCSRILPAVVLVDSNNCIYAAALSIIVLHAVVLHAMLKSLNWILKLKLAEARFRSAL